AENPPTITLLGPGTNEVTVDGGLHFTNFGSVTVSGITATGATATGQVSTVLFASVVFNGGGVNVNMLSPAGGLLSLVDSQIVNSGGPGVSGTFASIALTNTLIGNSAGPGLKAVAIGAVSIVQSRIENNAGSGVATLGLRSIYGDIALT